MITLWLYSKDCLHYPVYNRNNIMSSDGSVDLSNIEWYTRLDYELGNVKVDLNFLTQGFEI